MSLLLRFLYFPKQNNYQKDKNYQFDNFKSSVIILYTKNNEKNDQISLPSHK